MVLKPDSDENNDIKETVAEKGDAIAEMEEDLVFDQPRLKRATLAEWQLHPLECDMYASLAIGKMMKAVPATMRATPCGTTVAGSQERQSLRMRATPASVPSAHQPLRMAGASGRYAVRERGVQHNSEGPR